MEFRHETVLAEEVVRYVPERDALVVVDATLGGGGHSLRVLQVRPSALLIGIDRDERALAAARLRLNDYSARCHFVCERFSGVSEVLQTLSVAKIDFLIADLGVSSPQIDHPERGFSFMREGPLDMRMGEGGDLKTLLNDLSEEALADIIYRYGEERLSRPIARAICEQRATLQTTTQLAEVIRTAIQKRGGHFSAIDPATRTFQALRIAVNQELLELERLLEQLPAIVAPEGVVAIISFHSLEDRLVKQAFAGWAKACVCPPRLVQCICQRKPLFEVLTHRPIVAAEAEVSRNPRARSAKLRVARRLNHER